MDPPEYRIVPLRQFFGHFVVFYRSLVGFFKDISDTVALCEKLKSLDVVAAKYTTFTFLCSRSLSKTSALGPGHSDVNFNDFYANGAGV